MGLQVILFIVIIKLQELSFQVLLLATINHQQQVFLVNLGVVPTTWVLIRRLGVKREGVL